MPFNVSINPPNTGGGIPTAPSPGTGLGPGVTGSPMSGGGRGPSFDEWLMWMGVRKEDLSPEEYLSLKERWEQTEGPMAQKEEDIAMMKLALAERAMREAGRPGNPGASSGGGNEQGEASWDEEFWANTVGSNRNPWSFMSPGANNDYARARGGR